MLVFGPEKLFDMSLLAIRSCGCKAHIILFAMKNRTWKPSFARVIDFTETEVVGEDPPRVLTAEWAMGHYLSNFLAERGSAYDRIFRMDSFDVWCERDPFQIFEPDDGMVFFQECIKHDSGSVNGYWAARCFGGRGYHRLAAHWVINAGTIMGTTAAFIKYLAIFMRDEYWIRCRYDQPMVNWIIWTGELTQANISFRTLPASGPVLAMRLCERSLRLVNGVGVTINEAGNVPIIAHQFVPFALYTKAYYDRCPGADRSAMEKPK
jgi:hypothetical protein